jgi:hypothetical protein
MAIRIGKTEEKPYWDTPTAAIRRRAASSGSGRVDWAVDEGALGWRFGGLGDPGGKVEVYVATCNYIKAIARDYNLTHPLNHNLPKLNLQRNISICHVATDVVNPSSI